MSAVPERLRSLLAGDSPAQELAARLADAGYACALVGGSVRDALMDRVRSDHDLDFATNARPDAVEEIVRGWADAVWLQGQRFGTVGCLRRGVKLEITTYRAEVYRSESRKPEVVYSDDLETDLSRRDFTVNAMALQLPDTLLVDPFGGAIDLADRRLRTPLDPDISFEDDPLRMLRAARFIADLRLAPVPELIESVTRLRGRMEIVSAERIFDELSKLLMTEDPSAGLWFLAQTGLSDEFLPELNAMRLEQDPVHHHKDVLEHTIAVVAKTKPELRVRLAALLHDVGKPKTRSFAKKNGVSFHHHEVVGARMAEDRMRALRAPNELISDVKQLVFLHLRIHTYAMGWTDSAVRRYARDAGPLLDDLNHLQRCDCTTRNRNKARALERRMDELEQRIAALREEEELASIRPSLDGRQVMAYLGVAPGRVVGRALDALLELRLERGAITSDEAYAYLDQWAREQGVEPVGTRLQVEETSD